MTHSSCGLPNVDSMIKNPEDLQFLESMRNDRKASFGARDRNLANQLTRKRKRDEAEKARREREKVRKLDTTNCQSTGEFSSTDGDESEEADETQPSTSKRSHHRVKRTGATITIKPDILKHPDVVTVATRTGISPTDQATLTRTIVKACGGDPSKMASSYSTADRVNDGRRPPIQILPDLTFTFTLEHVPLTSD